MIIHKYVIHLSKKKTILLTVTLNVLIHNALDYKYYNIMLTLQ